MSGYAKLFASIVNSTIWRAPNHVRLVWITMLAMKDRDGIVESSVPGLADAARVSLAECVEALAVLSAPDEWSRTKTDEGRRIRGVEGGWFIINHPIYLAKMSADVQRQQTADRVARFRERARNAAVTLVTPVTLGSAEKRHEDEDEDEDEKVETTPPAGAASRPSLLPAIPGAEGPPTPATPENAPTATAGPGNAGSGQSSLPGIAPGRRRGDAAAQEQRVFDSWRTVLGHPKAVLDPARRRRIRWALDHYGEPQALVAIRGCAASEFHRGANDAGKVYDDVTLIFRDAAHAERFIEAGLALDRERAKRERADELEREVLAIPAPAEAGRGP